MTLVDKNKENWVLINHDLYGSRSSNQTTIGKDNVDELQVKWRWLNEYEIQDPPIINEGKGYVQDYAGNVIALILEQDILSGILVRVAGQLWVWLMILGQSLQVLQQMPLL